jgi:hypothetical protein
VIGLIAQNTIYDEVAMEMLDHQGICYESMGASGGSDKKFPAVVVPTDFESSVTLAQSRCLLRENVIVLEHLVDLPRILMSLSGHDEASADRFEPFLNAEEAKIVRSLQSAMSRLGLPLTVKWFWPGGANACCVLTHDVDWLAYSPFHRAILGGSLGPASLMRLLIGGIRGRNYGCNVPFAVQLEKRRNLKSTFLFKTDYPDGTDSAQKSVSFLRREGFEIALHASRSAHAEGASLKGELDEFRRKFGADTAGVRHHILKFEAPTTWLLETEARMQYDSTFAFNEFFGFRGELCFPYRPFDQTRLPILELPLSFMDWTALHRGQRGMKFRGALEEVKRIVDKYHGVLVVNFHNTYLNRETFPDVVDAYEWLLDETVRNDYWVTTARDCAAWWTFRSVSGPEVRMEDDNVPTESVGRLMMAEVTAEGYKVSHNEDARVERTV